MKKVGHHELQDVLRDFHQFEKEDQFENLLFSNEEMRQSYDRECWNIQYPYHHQAATPSKFARIVICFYLHTNYDKFKFDGEEKDWTLNHCGHWSLNITVRFIRISSASLFVRFQIQPRLNFSGGEALFVITKYEILPKGSSFRNKYINANETDATNSSIQLDYEPKQKKKKISKEEVVIQAQEAKARAEKRIRDEEDEEDSRPVTRSRSAVGGNHTPTLASSLQPSVSSPQPSQASQPFQPPVSSPRPQTPPLVRHNRSTWNDSAKKSEEKKKELSKIKKRLSSMTENAKSKEKEDTEYVEFWETPKRKRNLRAKQE